jgi:receptor protein-tyrosine kinase
MDANLPEEIAVAHTPYSPFAEALRGLRSQLMLRWFDGSPQQTALALTSVDRGDGKSFICANLGVVFAQLGERTLIIDADLRNSTQHKKFGLHNKMGLSGVLSGRAGVEEILAVNGLPNLAVLPAGPLPPNPQELLGREDFGRMLQALSASFDVILIDTPSAQQASDAQVVAQRARAALIVGRKDKTKTTEISQLGAVMSGSGIKILGAALNDY